MISLKVKITRKQVFWKATFIHEVHFMLKSTCTLEYIISVKCDVEFFFDCRLMSSNCHRILIG